MVLHKRSKKKSRKKSNKVGYFIRKGRVYKAYKGRKDSSGKKLRSKTHVYRKKATAKKMEAKKSRKRRSVYGGNKGDIRRSTKRAYSKKKKSKFRSGKGKGKRRRGPRTKPKPLAHVIRAQNKNLRKRFNELTDREKEALIGLLELDWRERFRKTHPRLTETQFKSLQKEVQRDREDFFKRISRKDK